MQSVKYYIIYKKKYIYNKIKIKSYIIEKVEWKRHPEIEQSESVTVDGDTDGHIGAGRMGREAGTISTAVSAIIVFQQHLAPLHIDHGHSPTVGRCQNLQQSV